jgi:hypothetical protein
MPPGGATSRTTGLSPSWAKSLHVCHSFALGQKYHKNFLKSISTSVTYTCKETIMAKTARKNRKRNARREARELRAAMRGEGKRTKVRNLDMLGLILRNGSGSHGDEKKRRNKNACRGTVKDEG